MLPFLSPGLVTIASSGPLPGQQLFTVSGDLTVTQAMIDGGLSLVAVGAGSAGGESISGFGGGLVYINGVSGLVLGETLTVRFNQITLRDIIINNQAGTLIARCNASSPFNRGSGQLGSAQTGFATAGGSYGYSVDGNASGGGAGRYTGVAGPDGTEGTFSPGTGTSVFGPTYPTSGQYGGGQGVSGGFASGSTGGSAVRFIWGLGRAFPNTNTGDL
jgi:hypothetical protein